MITGLGTQNFKSWEDSGMLRLAPLTGFFGANNSGKNQPLADIASAQADCRSAATRLE